MGAPAPVLLRPLGVGEIIDRALTLYVRNFVVFTGTVLAVIFIPMGIGEYLLLGDQSSVLQAYMQILQHPNATPPPIFNTNMSVPDIVVGFCVLLIAIALAPFAINAVAINTAAIYRARPPSITHALAATFRRAGPLIGLFFLEVAIAFGAYVVLMLLIALGVIGAIATVGASAGNFNWLVIIPLVLLGFVALLALFVFGTLLLITLAFAGYAVVIEGRGPVEALGSGFNRVFNRKEWGKAVLIGLVAMLLGLGISMFSSFGGFALYFVPGSHLLETIWSTIISAISYTVQTVFYAVYYFDVRVRREGLDLEEALGRLAPSAP